MDLSHTRMFSEFLKTVLVLYCVFFTDFVRSNDSTRLDILRKRVQQMDTRLSEDIALIREELYHELGALATKSSEHNDSDNSKKSELNNNFENTNFQTEIDELETNVLIKIKTLQRGLSEEKRVRRGIESEIQVINADESGLVNSIEAMTKNVTANFENVLGKLNAKQELFEIISLLKSLKEQLNDLQDFQNKKESSKLVSGCMELFMKGHHTSGIYMVFPKTIWRPLKVFCDMETDGGGWTVFQRRKDGSENFNRKWLDYSFGFGNLSGEFWLGNEFVYRLTTQVPHELRIELEDFENDRRVAKYGLFSVGNVDAGYKLSVNSFEGNVTDSLTGEHNGTEFSTTDRGPSTDCSYSYKGGWWYRSCHNVNINGLYLQGHHKSYADGINWRGWKGYHYSLKMTEMKFRPK